MNILVPEVKGTTPKAHTIRPKWHMSTKFGIMRNAKCLVTNIYLHKAVGPIAQLVEQRTFNPWVDGSSPSGPTHSYIVFSGRVRENSKRFIRHLSMAKE
jgi:hypothetical protein